MSNQEILKKIQDSAIAEYDTYKERIIKLSGKEIFERAGEIYAYECIVSYFVGIDAELDYDTNTGEQLIELFGEDVPNDIISALVNVYYDTDCINLGYWEGVEELIGILYDEEH